VRPQHRTATAASILEKQADAADIDAGHGADGLLSDIPAVDDEFGAGNERRLVGGGYIAQ
jgi:hypothetical protein